MGQEKATEKLSEGLRGASDRVHGMSFVLSENDLFELSPVVGDWLAANHIESGLNATLEVLELTQKI